MNWRTGIFAGGWRRLAFAGIGACLLAGCQTRPPSAPPPATASLAGSVVYHVRESLTLVNDGPGKPTRQNLWLALVPDAPPYQEVLKVDIQPQGYREFSDENGNRYVEFDFSDMAPGETIPVEVDYEVRVSPYAPDLGACQGDSIAGFIAPELHIESDNPEIVELSSQLAQGRATACAKLRAFYDYIGSHLVYTFNGRDWGAQAALGPMGADCTEYSDLLIALSRAAGIPARYVEGLYFGPEENARTEHAWVEVYLPGVGWTPVDPTLGRSSVSSDAYFARIPANHILITRGRNPSPLRGGSYFSHLYWPGNSTTIRVEDYRWAIEPVQ